jgi:hypothetical protein
MVSPPRRALFALLAAACLSCAGESSGPPPSTPAKEAGPAPAPRTKAKRSHRPALSVEEADDALMLTQAEAATGEEKLRLLDTVANRKGRRALEASRAARAERVKEIRRQLEAGNATAALASLEQSFPSWEGQAEPEIEGLRARAHDLAFAACTDAVCRFDASAKALASFGTPEREARAEKFRNQLVESLSFAALEQETTLARLQRLGALSSLATDIIDGVSDKEMRLKARQAHDFARIERAKVPLIGNDDGVAAELLGELTPIGPKLMSIELDGIEAFLVLDAQRKCRGLYAAGKRGARALPSSGLWPADRVLSQAVGREMLTKRPPAGDGTVRWTQDKVPIVARWNGDNLIELRIGNAAP